MASLCTLVTSGQVASTAVRLRSFASARRAGLTPWALKTTMEPLGTSYSSSMNFTPRPRNRSTTCRLCTIS